MSRKRPRLDGAGVDERNPDWSRACVLDNGMITPKVNRAGMDRRGIPNPAAATENLYALNTLQQRQDSPCNDTILKYSLQAWMSYLPDEVYNNIYVGDVPGEETDFSIFVSDEDFEARLSTRWPQDHDMYINMKQSPYFFWPINTGDNHYVTLIMVLGINGTKAQERLRALEDQRRIHDPTLEMPVPWEEVVQWSIVDPKRGHLNAEGKEQNQRERDRHVLRIQHVKKRVRRILSHGGIKWLKETEYMSTVEEPKFSLPWIPPQLDEWSSGFRSFALIKKQCEVVLDLHCGEEIWLETYFWQSAMGYFNPHATRHEMMGLLAVGCIRDMNWQARIAIEPVHLLDGINGQQGFPARLLRPTAEITTYTPQVQLDGTDQMRVSRGSPVNILHHPVYYQRKKQTGFKEPQGH